MMIIAIAAYIIFMVFGMAITRGLYDDDKRVLGISLSIIWPITVWCIFSWVVFNFLFNLIKWAITGEK